MDKRMLLAIILSIAILVIYQYFFIKPVPQPVPQEKAVQETVKEETKKTEAAPKAAVASIPKTKTVSVVEKEVRVESDLYIIVFSAKGGTIKSVELKKYKDKDGRPIMLKGDDILPPLSIGVDEGFQFSNVGFSVHDKDIKLSPSTSRATLIFGYSSGEHSIRRTYTLTNNDYAIELRDEISGLNSYWLTIGREFGIYEKDDSVHFGPVVLKDADRMEFALTKLGDPKSFRDGVKWIAQEDKYFFSSIVPKSRIEEAKLWNRNGDTVAALKMPAGDNSYLIYAGPKEYDRLKKLGAGLEHIIDFGFFSIISMPLFWLMKAFYDIFPNYGVSIIILTILVRIPFIPLINKGQASMKKLQNVQPKMAEIKERYKNDPQKMQKELMEMYKKHKVNPMGGCLPILLQIPVFFALYKVLMIAIELRGAPFMLWVKDLSVKDPYFILPIVMGVTMVIQQKMTPSTMDPTQQKIMMLMPVVFTFLFLSFPSGLVLYWLVNNVLSIAQQLYMNRKLAKQPA